MVFEQPIATKVFDKQILGRLQKRRWGRQGSRKESFVVPHYSLKVLAPELRRVHSVGITKPEIVMWGDGSDDAHFAVRSRGDLDCRKQSGTSLGEDTRRGITADVPTILIF